MTTVNQVTGQTGTTSATTAGQTTLGKDAFLQLLAAQLQHQDPLDPMKDAEFMGQMAQFSTLEQITNVGAGIQKLTADTQLGRAVAMIGLPVTYEQDDGSVAAGTVASVQSKDGTVVLNVSGAEVGLDQLRSVAQKESNQP